MRQLFINGRFLAGAVTAVNTVALDLSCALAKATQNGTAGWNVTLAVPPDLQEQACATGLAVKVVGRRNGILWEQTELLHLARQGVIAGFFNTVPMRGKGHVTMLHDAQVFTTPGSYKAATRMWRQTLARRAAASGNYVLTVSEHSKQALLGVGLGAADQIGVVPNGLGQVGHTIPDAAILKRLSLTKGARWSVALATVLPHKNIRLLLQAFADPALQDHKLILVGRSDAQDFAAAGMSVSPNVIFAGFVSDAELAALYRGASSVCVPSTQEGFGLPALEGMAQGAPVLAADCAALPEVLGGAGWILPHDQSTAWVQALGVLSTDPGRRAALSAAGRARAAQFTWGAAAARTLEHLDRWFPGAEA
ncbi:glycosyltransferase family 1 protein [Sulfitobacter sp. SK012]|uniref:glycosyltransferase family 4 protein n=1 Tax=Sulfitobacter sp. SK012 TaxID=1389005 RepID=UPI000E0C7A03|nr:glycosyltransferase family 1 protein [Sulfitobacter sp. SK012]AXI46698.1 glycosyltransferase family 1 protein [Sulfitobacter sp. SK012]